jgi:uncharacterized protein YndB with AHSA1/START domain
MAGAKGKDLVITRVFGAPVERVWQAWSDPGAVGQWWGPKDFTAPHIKIDFRVGGKYLYCMRGAGVDGVVRDFWSCGKYLEIEPMKKIVATDSFADEFGNVVPASHYGMEGDFPSELKVVFSFEGKGGETTMKLRHVGLPAGQMQELTGTSWNQSFDKLEEALKAGKK